MKFIHGETTVWVNVDLDTVYTPVSLPTKVLQMEDVRVEQLCAGTSHSIVWTSRPVGRLVPWHDVINRACVS